jgi:hypothetical protein
VTTPAQGEYAAVSIGPGNALTGLDFGNFHSLIGGRVFSDLNDNGAYDAEPGLHGWTVELRNAADSTLVKSIATDASGNYFFSMPPGTYLLDEVSKTGWRRTLPTGGLYVGLQVDTISGATNITGKDFGNFEYGILRVELTMDLNGNGVQDEADIIPLPYGNVGTFTLTRNGVRLKTTKVGNAESASTFDSLDEGIYRIEETVMPSGWIMTAGGVRGTFTKIIGGGSVRDTARYLNFALNTINGQVFNDLNGNGVKEATEPGLAGWIVRLSGASTAIATTDSLGRYSFANVGPGTYIVAESLQAGWRRTLPAGSGTYTINAMGAIQIAVHNNNNFGNKSTVSGVDDGELIPKQFSLQQGYPNPFNPTVTIGFALPEDAYVTLKVYNLLGQEIATLTDHERLSAGVHQVQFNAGQSPSGIYFYRIAAFDPGQGTVKFQDVRKMILLK